MKKRINARERRICQKNKTKKKIDLLTNIKVIKVNTFIDGMFDTSILNNEYLHVDVSNKIFVSESLYDKIKSVFNNDIDKANHYIETRCDKIDDTFMDITPSIRRLLSITHISTDKLDEEMSNLKNELIESLKLSGEQIEINDQYGCIGASFSNVYSKIK